MKKKKYITPCVQLEQKNQEQSQVMGLTRSLMLKKTTTTKYLYYNVHKGGFATKGATRLFISASLCYK